METKIKGIYLGSQGPDTVDIFGYTSGGMPGVEIIGIGSLGKNIKEKFIFLSKERGMKIPLKRYVICVDLKTGLPTSEKKDYLWLEFPLLILFWTLAEQLPIQRLEDCFSHGKLSVKGDVTQFVLSQEYWKKLGQVRSLKFIGDPAVLLNQHISLIPSVDLFQAIPFLNFIS